MQECADLLRYPLTFTDKFGQEKTECFSTGQRFTITLRGIKFCGSSLNSLEPADGYDPEGLFLLDDDTCPAECVYEIEVPLRIKTPLGISQAMSRVTFDYRRANDGAGDSLYGILMLNGLTIRSTKTFDAIEYLIMDWQVQLPEGYSIECCLSCRNSHYSPFGANDIGDIFCFKDYAERLDAVLDKCELFALWEIAVSENKLHQMQETYRCDQFILQNGGTWNYKDWDYIVNASTPAK